MILDLPGWILVHTDLLRDYMMLNWLVCRPRCALTQGPATGREETTLGNSYASFMLTFVCRKLGLGRGGESLKGEQQLSSAEGEK